jgi:hypothetical protein
MLHGLSLSSFPGKNGGKYHADKKSADIVILLLRYGLLAKNRQQKGVIPTCHQPVGDNSS